MFRSLFFSVFIILSLILSHNLWANSNSSNTEQLILAQSHHTWVFIASMLVIFMTIPGVAIYFCGFIDRKNILACILQVFFCTSIVTILWVLFGYGLVFADGGSFNWFIGWKPSLARDLLSYDHINQNYYKLSSMFFQLGFAIITCALMVGAFAARMKFKAVITFVTLWFILVYLPVAHWVWGGGWLQKLGMIDFAGGDVVHLNSGVGALVATIMLGRRNSYHLVKGVRHNILISTIGVGLIWLGWFGFNGASGGTFPRDVIASVLTQVATCAAIIAWAITEWVRYGRPSGSGCLLAAVAGLVAITPAAGYVGFIGAIVIGVVAGFICSFAKSVSSFFKYDDPCDCFMIHGVGGIIGALLTGIFCKKFLGGYGSNLGMGAQFGVQVLGLISTIIWSGVISYIILKLLDRCIGIRVTKEQEKQGLDLSEHNETGYDWGDEK